MAPKLVEDGRTGFVVDDEHAMAATVARLGKIDPAECRRSCERRFGVETVVRRYEDVYRDAAHPVRVPGRLN